MGKQVHKLDSKLAPMPVVKRFLDLLHRGDIDGAMGLLAVDVSYANVSLPTVHGRERVRRVFQATLGRANAGFEVYVQTIAVDGPSVLVERTDVLKFCRLRFQFWVCGRFDVRDGEIVLWRDYFDWLNVTVATMRGLLGSILPAVRAKPPRDTGT